MSGKKNCYTCAHYSIGYESWEMPHIKWPQCDKKGPNRDAEWRRDENMQEPGYMDRYKRCWQADSHSPNPQERP